MQEEKEILNKKQFYEMYDKNLFGNKALAWNSYKEILDSSWRGNICIRSKIGFARKKVRYNVPREKIAEIIKEFEEEGIKKESITFNQSMPDDFILIQGEVSSSDFNINEENSSPLRMRYSLIRKPMLLALAEKDEEVYGLKVLEILRHFLWENSYNNIMELLEEYPEHVIEFSAYNKEVGDIKGRNAVIWEVRKY
jgi:hypothetical protein